MPGAQGVQVGGEDVGGPVGRGAGVLADQVQGEPVDERVQAPGLQRDVEVGARPAGLHQRPEHLRGVEREQLPRHGRLRLWRRGGESSCRTRSCTRRAGGRAARHLLHARRLSVVLLLVGPLLDVVLLVATAVDPRSGTTASLEHGPAALHLGFSVASGHPLVHWTDVRFAHCSPAGRLRSSAPGRRAPAPAGADVGRTLLAVTIAGVVLLGLIAWVDVPERTEALRAELPLLGLITGLELLWSVSCTVWPRRPTQVAAGD